MFEYRCAGTTSRQRKRRLLAAFAVCSVLVGGALGAGAERAVGSSVSVSVSIRPSVSATFTDSGVVVRSNTAWRAETTARTADGGVSGDIRGDATGASGYFIELGSGEELVSLVAE